LTDASRLRFVGEIADMPEGDVAALSSNGQLMAISHGPDRGTGEIWEMKPRKVRCKISTDRNRGLRAISFSPDHRRLFGEDGVCVYQWSAETGNLGKSTVGPGEILDLVVSPDGQFVAAVANPENGDKGVYRFRCESLEPMPTLPQGKRFFGKLTVNPVSRRIAVSVHGAAGQVAVLSVEDPTSVTTLDWPTDNSEGPVRTLTYSHDGRYLAACRDRGKARIWKTADWTVAAEVGRGKDSKGQFDPSESAFYALAFSPDDSMLGSGDSARQVVLWNIADGKPVGKDRIPLGQGIHANFANWLAFHPDGKQLVSIDPISRPVLWELDVPPHRAPK
jgi:WD40 repeat protein